ncbi:unnamed protein product [Acanthosepion pharaonis]|uniref:Uncharacterized protein n=1 Tax=Acanthosepion pharaonis TaxID=158019 RepID=A0A812EDJ0_ACAPH|nr:unnamed protein product [Sepia pharaonis]
MARHVQATHVRLSATSAHSGRHSLRDYGHRNAHYDREQRRPTLSLPGTFARGAIKRSADPANTIGRRIALAPRVPLRLPFARRRRVVTAPFRPPPAPSGRSPFVFRTNAVRNFAERPAGDDAVRLANEGRSVDYHFPLAHSEAITDGTGTARLGPLRNRPDKSTQCSSLLQSFVRGRRTPEMRITSKMRESVAVLRSRSPYARNAHYELNARVRCSPSFAVAVRPKRTLRVKSASPLQFFVRGHLLRSRTPYARNAHYELKARVRCSPSSAVASVAVLRPRSPYSRNAHYEVNALVSCSPSSAVAVRGPVLPQCALRGKCASPLQSFVRGRRSPSSGRNAHYEVNARVRCSPSFAVAVLPKCALRGKCASPLQSFVRGRRTPEMRITR